jgi:hypothetical protein
MAHIAAAGKGGKRRLSRSEFADPPHSCGLSENIPFSAVDVDPPIRVKPKHKRRDVLAWFAGVGAAAERGGI